VGGDAGGDPAYILYDTKSILRELTDIVGRAREDETTDVDDLVVKSFQNNILGFISLGGGRVGEARGLRGGAGLLRALR
jgi:hypothetical protein